MNKPIFIAASPNTQFKDAFFAKSLLLRPWTWKQKIRIKNLEEELRKYLNVQYVHTIDSARSGIYIALKAMGVGEGDEVILPSFTCLVVANAVRWTGATPVYLDSNENDFNANYDDVELKITDKTKAIFVQHTFGKIVNIEKMSRSPQLKARNIYIIEDWAHTVSRKMKLQGDVAVLTFGIEKVLSGVRGGAIVTNDEKLQSKINNLISELPAFPISKSLKSLVNPIFWYIATPLHAVGYKSATLGAGLRWVFRKLGFLGNMIEKEEHTGKKPNWLPTKISPVLATLTHIQLKKLDAMNAHRTRIAKIYDDLLRKLSDYEVFDENRVWLRYPIRIQESAIKKAIVTEAKKMRIILGDWYKAPLYSKYVNERTYEENCYVPATTPQTTKFCKQVLNLPTGINVSEKRARKLVEKVLSFQ